MADEVKGIQLHSDHFRALSRLSDDQRGRLLLALIADAGFCDMPDMDFPTSLVFDMVIPGVHKAQESYKRQHDANVENGRKGGRPKKKQSDTSETDGIAEKPMGFKDNQSVLEENPKNQNRIEGNRIEESPSLSLVSPEPKTKRFIPPTPEEVQAYCDERRNGIDGQEFVDSYQSKGWMIGKTKMKDWRAAVRTWEQKRKQEEPEWQCPEWVGSGYND